MSYCPAKPGKEEVKINYPMNEGFECPGTTDLDVLLKNTARIGTVLSDETGAFGLNIDRDDIVALDSNILQN